MADDDRVLAAITASGVPVRVPEPTVALASDWLASADRLRRLMQSIDDPARPPFFAPSTAADAG